MKKIKELYEKLDSKKLSYIVLFTVLLNILLDLDNAIYPFLQTIGLPRPSTIFKFIIIPLLILLLFIKLEDNKKKVLKYVIIYGLILGIYFVVHCYIAKGSVDKYYLTNNFFFSLKDEFFNVFTLVLPYAFIYVSYKAKLSDDILEKTAVFSSIIVAIPIVISDIFEFGLSTYGGTCLGNFICWFTKDLGELPHFYTSKFFFAEGNTIGVVLFCTLPLLYCFMYKNRENKKKFWLLTLLTFIHSCAMLMLGTRVATYGAFLVPAMMFAMLVVLAVFKKEKWCIKFLIITFVVATLFLAIFKYTPAYKNTLVDRSADALLKSNYDKNDDYIKNARDSLKKLMNDDVEFRYEQIYNFEIYSWLIKNTPEQFYLDYYNYKFDPYFWLTYIFDYDFTERMNQRQTEKIFMNYKWNGKADTLDHVFGMGYSTFMNGSIICEEDFIKQFYVYGYTGSVIICAPWVVCLLILIVKTILGFKDKWNMLNITLLASICLFFVSAYVCSHVLDQFPTSFMLAMFMGALFSRLKKKKEIENA